MFKEKKIICLGGGSAGLAAAVRLIDGGKKNVVVIEEQRDVGGLAASFQYRDCKVDYGPHAFHCKNDAADALFQRFCPKGYRDIFMKACLFLRGKYFDYPLKFGQALFRLNPFFSLLMIGNYILAQAKRMIMHVPEDSFEAWGVKRYGQTMYDLAFGHYSRRVWGTPTDQLHWKMAQQKLPDLNFWELVKETLGGKGAKQKILYSSYCYPNGGIGTVFEEMESFIQISGGQVLKSATPKKIKLNSEGGVESVLVETKEGDCEIPCEQLIVTIPLSTLFQMLTPQPEAEMFHASQKLLYRHLVLVMLEVAMENVTDQIMVYLLDQHFTFHRIGEQKNIDASMIPRDKTILCFEICSDEAGAIWKSSDKELVELAKKDLSKLVKIPDEKFTHFVVKRLKHVYPVYDLTFDVNLNMTLDYLMGVSNLIPLGRQGLFIHNDIHDSMKMGIEGAEFVLSEKPKSVWHAQIRQWLNWRLS